MIAADLWQASKQRGWRAHPPRPRRPRLGELVQIDGSPHDWFTSRVGYARFVPVESTQAYLDALHAYVATYGCPVALYSDRHGIFTKHDPQDPEPTQFQRALASLGIDSLQAPTPQAKGRVERLFQTLQDRLVKAMRLAGINDMDAANEFLPAFLEQHNARFAVPPEDPEDAHSPYTGDATTLARICAVHHKRKLSKDLVLSFEGQRYILQTGGQPRYALRGETVTVVRYPDGRIEIVRGEEILPFKVFDASRPASEPVDERALNARVDALVKQRRSPEKSRPAPDHPWRRYPGPQPSGAGQLASP